jgi:DNA-binding transcriptional ArsR family regulator
VPRTASDPKDKLDPVWKALADPTRRAVLDLLRDRPFTTTEIVDAFPHLTRFGVSGNVVKPVAGHQGTGGTEKPRDGK